jgi:hypothetical protein
MFSLREVADDKFIYRCRECGLESEISAPKPGNAAQEAVVYSRSHQCLPKPTRPAAIESPPARQH